MANQHTYTLDDEVDNDLLHYWKKYDYEVASIPDKRATRKLLWTPTSGLLRITLPMAERVRVSLIKNFGFTTAADFEKAYPHAAFAQIRADGRYGRLLQITKEKRVELTSFEDIHPGDTIELRLISAMYSVALKFQTYVRGVYIPHDSRNPSRIIDIKGVKSVTMGMEKPDDAPETFWDTVYDKLTDDVVDEFKKALQEQWERDYTSDGEPNFNLDDGSFTWSPPQGGIVYGHPQSSFPSTSDELIP